MIQAIAYSPLGDDICVLARKGDIQDVGDGTYRIGAFAGNFWTSWGDADNLDMLDESGDYDRFVDAWFHFNRLVDNR